MTVIPVVNCEDASCIEETLAIAKKFIFPADFVHFDVADGTFTFHKTWDDPKGWATARPPFEIEAHLMVEHPEKKVGDWITAGVRRLIIHIETVTPEIVRSIKEKCDAKKVELMLSSNPETPVEEFLPFREIVNNFQVLAVYPGPAAQKFLPLALDKIAFLRRMAPSATIEVDGGMTPETARLAKNAGANIIVSASYIFNASDPAAAYRELTDV